ncbi:MAG: DUF2723 domain-containing protein [Candidatus Lindowbacteria bacterium]|nr:DUF2723 domain-containing protein [Candidatus Lindowbacteria bacterium]
MSFFLYYTTSAPGIGTEDSGEIGAGVRLLTMIHAPGYPLYLISGHLFELISTFPGRGLVLFSVLCGSLGIGLFFWIFRNWLTISAAACGAIALLCCRLYWDAATQVEVYALQMVLMIACLGSILYWRDKPDGRHLRLIGFVFGLALAHHIGLLIHLPFFFLFAWYTTRDRIKITSQDAIAAAGYAAACLSLYFALMILSQRPGLPVISWRPINTINELVYIASGAGFKKLLFAVPPSEVVANLAALPVALFFSFPFFLSLLSLPGVITLYKSDKPLLLLLLSEIVVTIFHAANYDVLDPKSFLLPALLPVALLCSFGFTLLRDSAPILKQRSAELVILFFISALGGIFFSGKFMTTAFFTYPVDVSRIILEGQDIQNSFSSKQDPAFSDTSLIWADWHLFPTLRYIQVVEGLGKTVEIEMDSTATSPGKKYVPGRTYAMSPSLELGQHYSLIMDDLSWKVVDKAVRLKAEDETTETSLVEFGGLTILDVKQHPPAEFNPIISAEILLRRSDTATPSDTVVGAFILTKSSISIVRAPFSLLHWRHSPRDLDTGVIYREPIQILIPTSHYRGSSAQDYALKLRLFSGTTMQEIELGEIKISTGATP